MVNPYYLVFLTNRVILFLTHHQHSIHHQHFDSENVLDHFLTVKKTLITKKQNMTIFTEVGIFLEKCQNCLTTLEKILFFNSIVTITYLIIMTFTILKDRVHNRDDGIKQN